MKQVIHSGGVTAPSLFPTSRAGVVLTPGRVFGGLVLYFGLHVLWRVLVSSSVELDESEQLLLTQSWSWGYSGAQPPLYTWLQALLISVFGTTVFPLVLLKSTLLFGTYYFFYRASREVTGAVESGLLSAISLFFLPQIAWESQRDLTHTVLATSCAAATLFVCLRLLKTGALRWYVLLGLAAGAGLLAKYNYGIFLLALLVSAASLPAWRAQVLNFKMLAAAAVFLLLTSGHFHWLLQHADWGMASAKLTQRSTGELGKMYWSCGKSLLQAIINFAAPLVLVFGLVFFRGWREKRPSAATEEPKEKPINDSIKADGQAARLVQRTILGVLLVCVFALVAFKAHFKDRWMQPLLFSLPLACVLLVRARLSETRMKALAILATMAAATVLLVMPAIPLGASLTKRPNRLNAPWAELGAAIKKLGIAPGVIAADSCLPGGNLKLSFPKSLVLAPECKVIPPPRNVPWLIVWEMRADGQLPYGFAPWVSGLGGPDISKLPWATVEAPVKYFSARNKQLGYLVVQPER